MAKMALCAAFNALIPYHQNVHYGSAPVCRLKSLIFLFIIKERFGVIVLNNINFA